VTISKLLTN